MKIANSLEHIRPLRALLVTAVAAFCITQVGLAQGRAQGTIQVSATVVSVAPSRLAAEQALEVARLVARASPEARQRATSRSVRVVADLRQGGYVEARIEFVAN